MTCSRREKADLLLEMAADEYDWVSEYDDDTTAALLAMSINHLRSLAADDHLLSRAVADLTALTNVLKNR